MGTTLDPDLVSVIDAFVAADQGLDRSAVIDDALRLWQERQQERAMERQIREDASRYDHQPRRALVVSADVRNRLADDVIVTPDAVLRAVRRALGESVVEPG